MEEESYISNSSYLPDGLETTPKREMYIGSTERMADHTMADEANQSSENAQKQLVLYDPAVDGVGGVEPVTDATEYQTPTFQRLHFPKQTLRTLPSVGAFAVQCANCFKWRLIPRLEKYEEIREHIMEKPFLCETAREWRPEISCDDPPDIMQDGSRLWAIDKPNIAQPPPGWQRVLRIRGERGTKFADVYYLAPSGKRLRSMVEIQRYLDEHPKYIEEGVNLSRFSFQTPRPLQQNYVRRRPTRAAPSNNANNHGMPECLDPSEVKPISWAGPDVDTNLQLSGPWLSTHYSEVPIMKPENQSAKKKRTPSKRRHNGELVDQQKQVEVVESRQF